MRRIACGAFVVFTAAAAGAQADLGRLQQTIGTNQSIMAAILAPITGEPYQAEKVTTSRQVLSDGTVIAHETKGLIARDGMGRVREDLNLVQIGQVEGRQIHSSLKSATVGDPVRHDMLIWSGDSKIVLHMNLPSMPGTTPAMLSDPHSSAPGGVAASQSVSPGTVAAPGKGTAATASKDTVRTEDLGQQSMAGVMVTGKRTVTTIPLEEIGNDRPIVVVHEEWRSPELQIVVKTVDTDPRTGVQTTEVRNLDRIEPGEALFQAPAGYKVEDFATMFKALGELGRSHEK